MHSDEALHSHITIEVKSEEKLFILTSHKLESIATCFERICAKVIQKLASRIQEHVQPKSLFDFFFVSM